MQVKGNSLVSVILPAYNAAATLKPCLDAVLASDYPNLEVLVVDDGSTDSTADLAGAYPQVTVIRQENRGSAASKNHGARDARGEYFYFLDTDVVIFPDTISKFVETAIEHKADLVSGRYSTDPINKGLIHHYKALADYVLYIPPDKRDKVIINGQSGGGGDFYSARVFRKLDGYDERYQGACVEREELMIRFYNAGYTSVANVGISTRHYFPDFLRLVRNYVSRIFYTIELLENHNPPFTYISTEKAIISPAMAFLMVASLLLVLMGLLPWTVSGLLLAGFLFLNRDFLMTGVRKKGPALTLAMLPIHVVVCLIIFLAGASSKAFFLLRRLRG